MRPFVVKVTFYLLFQVLVNRSIVIEFSDQTEEPSELNSLIDRVIKFSEAINDLEQDTHEVWKNGHPQK